MKNTISDLNRFEIYDEETKLTSYGFDQQWYSTKWKQTAGCGPTIASSLALYLFLAKNGQTKEELLALQETMWKFVKPTWMGISTIQLFQKLYKKYFDFHQLDIAFNVFEVDKKMNDREAVDFNEFVMLEIDNNHPIAFLNRDNGNQNNLESWHWTIIVAYERIDEDLIVDVIDNGKLINLNITQWFNSTKRGGGCVSLSRKEEKYEKSTT